MYLPAIYAPQATISPDFYSLVSDIVPLKVESPPIQFQYPSPRSVEIVSSPQPEMVSSPKQREMVSSPKSITKSTSCQSLSPIKHKTKKRSLTDEDPVLLKKRQRQNEAAKRCREKRSNQLQMAQQQVQQIEQDKFDMAVKLAVIEKERDAWQIREQDLQQRIHQLKVQLDETQMLLFQCTN
ncbi:hypothetical protein BC833DRAFT_606350 [Globomyces pollinis-pini]|nr:hypothetical protein BC833DRAFT_606350 [Globomyces pollinis-pini]